MKDIFAGMKTTDDKLVEAKRITATETKLQSFSFLLEKSYLFFCQETF